jgi:peptide/nickel transport system permease protein
MNADPAKTSSQTVGLAAAPASTGLTTFPGGHRRVLGAIVRNPVAMSGLLILAIAFLVAVFAPLLYPLDPLAMVGQPFLWPGESFRFPLGTDSLGRDLAAGLAYGTRTSLGIGTCATAIGVMLGVVIGALSGYFGGVVDNILVRLTEIFQTLPSFVFVVVLVAIAGPSIVTIACSIGLVTWPTIARLVRAEFRSIREKEFVLAARGLGYGHFRIITVEILPNALPPIIVTTSIMLASAILWESALSFMGLGDPNIISWGSMIGAGREFLRTNWYLAALPGVAIVFVVLAMNLIGDGLNDALNPRLAKD